MVPFPGKDPLFATMVERVTRDRFSAVLERPSVRPGESLLRLLDALEEHRNSFVTLNDRRDHSPELAALYDGLYQVTWTMAREALMRSGLEEHDADLAAIALGYLLGGMLLHARLTNLL